MIRYFCDSCGAELRAEEHDSYYRKWGKVRVTVTSSSVDERGVTNKPSHVCWTCIQHAVAKGSR